MTQLALVDLEMTCNIVRRRSEYRLQQKEFGVESFRPLAGTLNAVSYRFEAPASFDYHRS